MFKKRNKKNVSTKRDEAPTGNIGAMHVSVPDEYWDMTDDEKLAFAKRLLDDFSPKNI